MEDLKGFYSSTDTFVAVNGLKEVADELFGQGWIAEDDVQQIENLLAHLGRKDLMVVLEPISHSENDIVVCERVFTFTINDLVDLKYKITEKLVENGIIEDCTGTDMEVEINTENAIEETFKEFLGFDYN
jgi:hypothetical protein